VKLVINGELT